MMYVIVWFLSVLWAAVEWGWVIGLVTFGVFFLVPPLIIACTLWYMEKNKIDRYHLDLVLLDFDLERNSKQRK